MQKMKKDEALVFKTYDSHHPDADTFIPTMHTAIDDPLCPAELADPAKTPRESIECRIFCFFPPKGGFSMVAKAKIGFHVMRMKAKL